MQRIVKLMGKRDGEAVATFRINQKLWDDFKAWANESGSNASALMKRYIEECVNQAPDSEISQLKAKVQQLEGIQEHVSALQSRVERLESQLKEMLR